MAARAAGRGTAARLETAVGAGRAPVDWARVAAVSSHRPAPEAEGEVEGEAEVKGGVVGSAEAKVEEVKVEAAVVAAGAV